MFIKRFSTVLITILVASYLHASIDLIPRTVLFGNPDKWHVRLSPDGTHLSYLASYNGVSNIWIKELDGNKQPELITQDTNRGISSYSWSIDGNNLLYVQDQDGDENWRLYTISIKTKQVRCYTPFDKVQVRILASHKDFPDTLLISLNKDNPELHDVYKLTLSSGNLELLEKNPGSYAGWLTDRFLAIRGAVAINPEGGKQVLLKNTETNCWQGLLSWNQEDSQNSGPSHFSYDGKSLYFFSSKGSNTSQLLKYDLASHKQEVIAQDPSYDVSGFLVHRDTYEIQAVYFNKDRPSWIFLDKELEEHYNYLTTVQSGDIVYLGSDNDFTKSLVVYYDDTHDIAYYLYDHQKKHASYLFGMNPALNNYKLAPMESISFASRDGLTIHGYLTKPVGATGKVPLVVHVHGGPRLRDNWGYSGEIQWLANRGYAILQVNYRGSSGFGKGFMHAGDREWGGKMQDDLVDGAHWAIAHGIADPKKIAIYGGSYGGYAALVGAVDNQDIFCCAVDVFGPSNLFSFIDTIPPYWQLFKNELYQMVGHPETDKDLLTARSPLFKAATIKMPLLIAHGANDARVKQAESEQIVKALKDNAIAHEYLLFPDEGHGFAKPENRLKFYAAAEKFLATHLGGRSEQ